MVWLNLIEVAIWFGLTIDIVAPLAAISYLLGASWETLTRTFVREEEQAIPIDHIPIPIVLLSAIGFTLLMKNQVALGFMVGRFFLLFVSRLMKVIGKGI